MATILKAEERAFKENPNKIDHYRILSDFSIINKGIKSQNLNFDIRQLNPKQYSSPYHFHRYAEELFMIISGSATVRTPEGLEIVNSGDLIFFEKGESGAHQLYNHTEEPCVFLDVCTFIGHDICEYPDSNKLFIVPTYEIFDKDSQVNYFKGEENIKEKWEEISNNKK
ncbi:MAG: cupin domain-containing protein [Candidatus Azobacteroides sp.]|nr:cupin domain-containing protein [Candidatus Azobacteroides sp.]